MFGKLFRSDKEIANDSFEEILNAIQNQDKSALKNVFSKRVHNETSDFDDSVADLLDFIKGAVLSIDDSAGVGTDEEIEYGKKRKEIQSSFGVETSEQKYYLAMRQCTVDTFDPDNVGIKSIYIINAKDWKVDYVYRGDGKWTPGIVIEKKKE